MKAMVYAAVSCAVSVLVPGARAQTGFVNFESTQVHPLDMTPDGQTLLAVNTADGRLEVLSLASGTPVWTRSISVGLEPVSVRARTSTEAWVVNALSDTVSVVNLTTGNVVATLATADEPADVVFAGSPAKAYVSTARPAQLMVFDPLNRAAAPATIPIVGLSPRALAADATRVYVALFLSGNGTSLAPRDAVSSPSSPYGGVNPPPNSGGIPGVFLPALAPGLGPAPASSLIMNREGGHWKDANNVLWDAQIPWGLALHGLAVVPVAGGPVTYAPNIDNITTGLAVRPSDGRVTFVGTHLTNYIRFEPADRNQFAKPFLVILDPSNPGGAITVRDMNPHLLANGVAGAYFNTATPAQVALTLADPRACVWNPSSSFLYVTGKGSNNIAKIGPIGVTAARAATINVGQGPTGLVYDTARARLYCLNQFDATVSVINASTDAVVATVGFFDPTPTVIKSGRPFHYDAHLTGGLGNASCNSCHIDTRNDTLAWDLGDPAGAMKAFDQACGEAGFGGVCNDWHPVKGPLMTQILTGIVGNGPMHWRGDRADLSQFTVGFTGLLGAAAPPSPAQMSMLEQFLGTLQFAPNPNRTISDGLPATVTGSAGSPSAGAALFATPGTFSAGGVSAACVDCHSSASGAGVGIVSGATLQQTQGLKTPPLRDLYLKAGFSMTSQVNVRGFGYTHDGGQESISTWLAVHAPSLSATQRADLEAFLLCWPTGTHPAVGQQQTFDGTNNTQPAAIARLATFVQLADAQSVGLIARGVVGGVVRGYLYVPGAGLMQSDRLNERVTPDALRLAAAAGTEITFTCVPASARLRSGLDRDGDGFFDRDELDASTNPANSASFPAPKCPQIALQPAGVSATVGQSVTLSAAAFGSPTPTVRWRRGGVLITGGVQASGAVISGATTPTLVLTGVTSAEAGDYDFQATNVCGTTTSVSATVTVVGPCNLADLTGLGGPPAPADTQLTVDDVIAFINLYSDGTGCPGAAPCSAADVCGLGGAPEPADGQLTVDDIIAFFNAFSDGCP